MTKRPRGTVAPRKRTRKAREKRRAREAASVADVARASQRHCTVSAAVAPGAGVVFGTSAGAFSRQNPTILRISDLDLVGALEEQRDFGGMLAKVGMLTVASILNFPVAEGPEALARALVNWSGIDVEALRASLDTEEDEPDDARVPDGGDTDPAPVGGPPADPETTGGGAEVPDGRVGERVNTPECDLCGGCSIERDHATSGCPGPTLGGEA